jgi:predicted nucleic acid-binding protein
VIIVDTNIVLDIATADPVWSEWSISVLEAADLEGGSRINDIIFAEICARYETVEQAAGLMRLLALDILPMPRDALFLASKAFLRYRLAGGVRTGVLPDFFIGAQASVLNLALATRDPARYRTYFPQLDIIAPPTAPTSD